LGWKSLTIFLQAFVWFSEQLRSKEEGWIGLSLSNV